MKYYTISFPGEYDQHVVETWSEEQILKSYYDYWKLRMKQAGKESEINEQTCIEDWITVHWGVRTDRWGNKLLDLEGDCY